MAVPVLYAMPRMGWMAYAIAWVSAALFWAPAASWGSNRPPRETLLHGLLAMGPAALMGLGVWAISRRVEWNPRSRRFPRRPWSRAPRIHRRLFRGQPPGPDFTTETASRRLTRRLMDFRSEEYGT